MSTPQAAAGVYGVSVRRLSILLHYLFITLQKPLGQKALEREDRLGTQNKQNPAGSLSITPRPCSSATPSFSLEPGSAGLKRSREGLTHVSSPSAHSRGPLSTLEDRPPPDSPSQQSPEPAWGLGGWLSDGFLSLPLQSPIQWVTRSYRLCP